MAPSWVCVVAGYGYGGQAMEVFSYLSGIFAESGLLGRYLVDLWYRGCTPYLSTCTLVLTYSRWLPCITVVVQYLVLGTNTW